VSAEDEQKTIEQEFVKSWDLIEQFYEYYTQSYFRSSQWLKPIFSLIHELRRRGYDRKFRAGQGMDRFQISRALKHGLRPGQPMLGFNILENGGMNVIYFEAGDVVEFQCERVELTPEVEELLARLLAHPID